MYPFYEVSVFKIKDVNEEIWAVVTLEGGNSTIVWMMDSEEDALDVRKMRLDEGGDRMTRYRGGQIVRELKSSTFPPVSEVTQYAVDNDFVWKLDLQHVIFENWSCIRLTRREVSEEALNSQT